VNTKGRLQWQRRSEKQGLKRETNILMVLKEKSLQVFQAKQTPGKNSDASESKVSPIKKLKLRNAQPFQPIVQRPLDFEF
jgi:hypothetical protein